MTEMSVEGVPRIFCVGGAPCVANNLGGACPGPQDGLPFGAYCDRIASGVAGCRPLTAAGRPTDATYAVPLDCTGNAAGDTPVSIVGATRAYCAPQPVCAGTIKGSCPSEQPGLVQNSTCAIIATGVYGCVFPA